MFVTIRKLTLALAVILAVPGLLGGCVASDLAISPPTDSTLVATPRTTATPTQFAQDDAACRAFAGGKARAARDERVTRGVLTTLGGMALGAGLGTATGSFYGVAGRGAGIGAASGALWGTGYGAIAGAGATPYQGVFDTWWTKCMEQVGHTVRAPGGYSYGVPGVPLR